jgi:galactose mutarotase-like enzyme
VILTTEDATATIRPDAGRLASLVIDGREILVTDDPRPFYWGSYPMAPFAGRLRHGSFRFDGRAWQLPTNWPPHAIHGFVAERGWQVNGPGLLSVDLGEPWPFRGRVVQQFDLVPGRLTWRLELHAAEPMPATIGWHPWFARQPRRVAAAAESTPEPGPLELDFAAEQMYAKDDEGIPTGELVPVRSGPWDDCFTAPVRPPVLRWPRFLELTIESDCRAWVVYDELPHAICVEPESGPPDSINFDPEIVTPGRPLVREMHWRWRPVRG